MLLYFDCRQRINTVPSFKQTELSMLNAHRSYTSYNIIYRFCI